jgi:hypothetical protein
MKFIWEEIDIIPGKCMVRQDAPVKIKEPRNGVITVTYMIGYMPESPEAPILISLADGLVLKFKCRESFLKNINNDEHGYRPITPEELVSVLMSARESKEW